MTRVSRGCCGFFGSVSNCCEGVTEESIGDTARHEGDHEIAVRHYDEAARRYHLSGYPEAERNSQRKAYLENLQRSREEALPSPKQSH